MIDFKTPVLARLKELAEQNNHPTLSVESSDYSTLCGRHGTEFHISRTHPLIGSKVRLLCVVDIYNRTMDMWANAAVVLRIFDDVVQAAFDATDPQGIFKNQVLAELKRLSQQDSHPTMAVFDLLRGDFRIIPRESSLAPWYGTMLEVNHWHKADHGCWAKAAERIGLVPSPADSTT